MIPDNLSPWTNFLEKNNEDPDSMYKDNLLLRCEKLVGTVTCEILEARPETQINDANEQAICLIMEQFIILQHEHTPQHQAAMTAALLLKLPALETFRADLVQEAERQQTFFSYIKNLFKRK
jgi:hypothetical protein